MQSIKINHSCRIFFSVRPMALLCDCLGGAYFHPLNTRHTDRPWTWPRPRPTQPSHLHRSNHSDHPPKVASDHLGKRMSRVVGGISKLYFFGHAQKCRTWKINFYMTCNKKTEGFRTLKVMILIILGFVEGDFFFQIVSM